jgi:hypothetical protein
VVADPAPPGAAADDMLTGGSFQWLHGGRKQCSRPVAAGSTGCELPSSLRTGSYTRTYSTRQAVARRSGLCSRSGVSLRLKLHDEYGPGEATDCNRAGRHGETSSGTDR